MRANQQSHWLNLILTASLPAEWDICTKAALMKNLAHLLILVLLTVSACSTSEPQNSDSQTIKTPKNIIFLIGDGMGVAQVSTAFYHGDTMPNFTRFQAVGLSQTSSASHKITDSAAGATAFSAGKRTYNGAIGVDSDTLPLPLITEVLSRERNMATGIVATSTITHATPGSFFAHVDYRWKQETIASYLHRSPIDFAAGAGLEYFISRPDSLNYLDSLVVAGFSVDTTQLGRNLKPGQKYAFLQNSPAGRGKGLPKIQEGRGDFLLQASLKAIESLSKNENGFFLMIEASQIDWGGHANDARYIEAETWDFDKVIGAVLDWAEKDGQTLIVVTADHETGGFALSGAPMFGKNDYNQVIGTFSTGNHTASLVPVFASGPGAYEFTGVFNNTDIHQKMMALMRQR